MKKRKLSIKKHIAKKIDYQTKSIRVVDKPKKESVEVNRNQNKSTVEIRREARTGKSVKLIDRKLDFDIMIFIASYNRYEKLNRLINQLLDGETKHTFKIFIIDDASNDIRYWNFKEKSGKIKYIRNRTNQGKKGYWKTINTVWNEIKKHTSNVVIQIDDDFILKDNFLDEIYDEYLEIKTKNKNIVALYYHRFVGDDGNRWGLGSNWFDGGVLFDYMYLEKIGFKIAPIGEIRWKKNPKLSSGVWEQLSKKITRERRIIKKTEKSYVMHDGNDDSVMNDKLRRKQKIVSNYG